MKIFVTLFRYFPYGGLARDCLKIAETLRDRGHEVTIFTEKWEGPRPEGIGVRVLESEAVSSPLPCSRGFAGGRVLRLHPAGILAEELVGKEVRVGINIQIAGFVKGGLGYDRSARTDEDPQKTNEFGRHGDTPDR